MSSTLVCHMWRAIAARYLFRAVSYAFTPDVSKPEGADKTNTLTLEKIYAFFDQHKELANHVRELSLAVDPRHIVSTIGNLFHLSLDSFDPGMFVRCFPRLEELHLCDVYVMKRSPQALPRTSFPFLTVLEIRSTRKNELSNSNSTNLLLGCFAEVDYVEIHIPLTFYFFSDARPADDPNPLERLAIRHLKLRGSPEAPLLLTQLSVSPSAHSIRSISIDNLREEQGLQTLLAATQGNLRCLHAGIFLETMAAQQAIHGRFSSLKLT